MYPFSPFLLETFLCMFVIIVSSVRKGSWKCKWTETSVKPMIHLVSVSLWIHCCVAADSRFSELVAAALWVDNYKWIFSLWETLYRAHHLCCSLLFPASPPLMRWCSCNLTHFIACRCCPLNIVWLANVFWPSRNENLLLVSRIILCVHSLSWRAWCVCFHSAGWLTLAPVPPFSNLG